MSGKVMNKLPKSYKCTKCNLRSSPLLVCSLSHKICGKCYDLFSHPTIICPICKLEFTTTEDFANQNVPQLTNNMTADNTISGGDLIDELFQGLPETTENSSFSVASDTEFQRIRKKEESSNRQIRKLCFMALWNTVTSVFGKNTRKSKGSTSPSQLFSNIIMNAFVRRMGTPAFLLLENYSQSSRTRSNTLYIGGGLLALLVILGKCTMSAKK